jgi:hypothetical protein
MPSTTTTTTKKRRARAPSIDFAQLPEALPRGHYARKIKAAGGYWTQPDNGPLTWWPVPKDAPDAPPAEQLRARADVIAMFGGYFVERRGARRTWVPRARAGRPPKEDKAARATKVRSARLAPGMWSALDELANARGTTANALLRQAVAELLRADGVANDVGGRKGRASRKA